MGSAECASYTKGLEKRAADEANQYAYPEWLYNISDFQDVIVDEAQVLKSFEAQGSLALRWLKVGMYVVVSATPMPNGIEDWAGYMSFIEHLDADQWWEEASLNAMGFAHVLNPYDVNSNHPAAKLVRTEHWAAAWPGTDSAE